MIIKTLHCPHCRATLSGAAVYGSEVRLGSKQQICPSCKKQFLDLARKEWVEMNACGKFEYYVVSVWLSFLWPCFIPTLAVAFWFWMPGVRGLQNNNTAEIPSMVRYNITVFLVGGLLGLLRLRSRLSEIKASQQRVQKTGKYGKENL